MKTKKKRKAAPSAEVYCYAAACGVDREVLEALMLSEPTALCTSYGEPIMVCWDHSPKRDHGSCVTAWVANDAAINLAAADQRFTIASGARYCGHEGAIWLGWSEDQDGMLAAVPYLADRSDLFPHERAELCKKLRSNKKAL